MAKKKHLDQAVCRKNDELLLEIEDMGTEGEGIGRVDGYTLFVKDALAGDTVRVRVMKTRKHFGYARLLEIIQPSPYRVTPECPVAKQCGGCQLQHCSYEKQLLWKQEKVVNCMRRIGGLDVRMSKEDGHFCKNAPAYEQEEVTDKTVFIEPIIGMEQPSHYRNKSQYPLGYDKEGKLVAGFYAGRTHTIIPSKDCVIGDEANEAILHTILSFMEEKKIAAYNEQTQSGLVRHILLRSAKATRQIMVCVVINGRTFPCVQELVQKLLQTNEQISSICLNSNEKNTNVILGEEVIPVYGNPYIEDCIGSIRYRISPLSFYQVNPVQTEKLYATALEYADLHGGETVWDLYCGIGTISLFLSQKADKVYGVEIVPQAIEDAKENAKLNGITNAEFFVGAAEDVVPSKYLESNGALRSDVVVLDPPRKGCDEKLLQTVIQMEPKRIVYVSCDPATLARDLKYFGENGYALKRIRPCDMFGHSYHVETVVLMSRQNQGFCGEPRN